MLRRFATKSKFRAASLMLLLLALTAAAEDTAASSRPGVQSIAAPTDTAALGISFIDGSTTTVIIERDGKQYLVDIAGRTARELNGDRSPAVPDASAPTKAAPESAAKSRVYRPGDDVVFTMPTGRHTQRHGLYVNFTHRFPDEAAFKGRARGHELLGLDSFGIPSFGFRFGVTSRLAVSAYRSPFTLNRVIEVGASYFIADELAGAPLNLVARVSFDGQNDFQRNFTTNFELITARSLGSRAQLYLVPTVSLHNRPLLAGFTSQPPRGYLSCSTPALVTAVGKLRACADTFSIGVGASVDVRKTVALVAEVIPTVVNARDMGIHRPPYSFGIQKKIWRHSFTFGFTTGPGTTVSQRAGTRATLLQSPTSDKPSGLFVGFDLTRQLR